jgi:glycosyltransferase-like protein
VEDYQSAYLRQCQENSIRLPDRCLCVSDYWQGFLAREYGVMAPRVINGVNRRRFSAQCSGAEAELKQRYGLTGWPIYLTVGGIEPRKNSLHLIQAFAEVLKLYADAQLVIAGGATLFDYQDYRQQFFVAAETLALPTQSLRLPGVVPAQDLPVLYRCADVFCFPSHREGWGLVVLEAIASKLPIIVSRCHPFTEFLAPDQALWVDPDDPQTIARAMVESLSPAAKTWVDRSQDILPNYSWSTSAQLHLEHYGQLLAQRSPG